MFTFRTSHCLVRIFESVLGEAVTVNDVCYRHMIIDFFWAKLITIKLEDE